MCEVSIKKGHISLAGILCKPTAQTGKTAGLIVVHPGGGVKEQTAGTYMQKDSAMPVSPQLSMIVGENLIFSKNQTNV